MRYIKHVMMALLALVILAGGMGASVQPAQAAACTYYHTVRYGESLSWIGRYYNVSWPYLAQINGIPAPRYPVYAGQVLCISGYYGGGTGGYPTGGYYGGYYTGNVRTWSFQVVEVSPNTSVTIRTYNAPSNIRLNVRMGAPAGGNAYNWIELGDLDTASGGTQTYILSIPAQFKNISPLKLRLTQTKKNGKVFQQDQLFYNTTAYNGGGTGGIPGWGYYPPYYTGTIPTIWITSVVRDNSVTIQTRNFPAGLTFDVLMGPMGTRGVGGYYVGTLNSGSGGTLVATYSIPSQLYGQRQIAIRTQNAGTGFHSYNWFYNNTTY